MSVRETVLKALRHESPGRVPFDIRFTSAARDKMAAYYGDPDFESKLGNCFSLFRLNTIRQVEPDLWEDRFGVRWDRSVDKDIGVVVNKLVTPESIKDYAFPNPSVPELYEGFKDKVANKGDTLSVVKLSYNYFERAWSLAGMEDLLMYMITEKEFVHDLLGRILDYNMAVIEHVTACDIDAVYFGDDWGQQSGLIMGPQLWKEFIKPGIRTMFQKVKSKEKLVLLHCCGDVREIFPDLIECGLDVFNPLQPEVMDPLAVKKQFGDRLSFYGGISTQRTLPFGTTGQVKDEVRRLLDVVGRDGGYIASPAHNIPADAKAENIAAMVEVLQEQ